MCLNSDPKQRLVRSGLTGSCAKDTSGQVGEKQNSQGQATKARPEGASDSAGGSNTYHLPLETLG